jgi:hypothetical protein
MEGATLDLASSADEHRNAAMLMNARRRYPGATLRKVESHADQAVVRSEARE